MHPVIYSIRFQNTADYFLKSFLQKEIFLEIKTSNIGIKKDCINLVASITLAIISYAVVAKLISIFYQPDLLLIMEKAQTLLIGPLLNGCRPEPLERTLFLAGIVLIPAFLAGYYFILKRFLNHKSEGDINKMWPVICAYTLIVLPVFIFIVLSARTAVDPRISYGQLYILFSILDKNIPLIIFAPFILVFYFLLKANYPPDNKTGKIMTAFFYVFCLLLIPYLSALYLFSVYTVDLHFDTVFYSMVQLFKGIPLGVDGFSNTYGLYPYFLNIIFKITGLSVLKCSIVFCVLIALSYLLIFLFLKNTVGNKLLMLLGFVSVIYFPKLSMNLFHTRTVLRNTGEFVSLAYYQYLPLRYIFPCLFLLLGALYIRNKNKSLYILISLISGLALLWNFDTGVIITLSWILLNIYSECELKDAKTFLKNSLRHLIKILSVIITTVLCFLLVVYIVYGRILNLGLFIQSSLVFSQFGFFLLPMPPVHPWSILALAYIAGMGISIRAIIEKDITPWTKNIFLVTVMGTGMLLYYQGRSHDYAFMNPLFYFFILLTLFLDNIFSYLRSHKNFLLTFLSLLIASTLSMAIILMAINFRDGISLVNTVFENIHHSRAEMNIQNNCEFIKKHTNPSEKIIIFAREEAIYFSRIPNASAFNPGFSECFLKTDYDRLEKLVAGSDVKFFISKVEGYLIVAFSGILDNMEEIDSNGQMGLLKRKSVKN